MPAFRYTIALMAAALIMSLPAACTTGNPTGTPSEVIPTASQGTTASPTYTAAVPTHTPSPIAARTLTPSPTPAAPSPPTRVSVTQARYVVFAWNDLGMHCINPTYDQLVLLPPYNNVWAQVVKRGNPPQIVTAGLTVEYSFVGNTYSYGKRAYGQFWDTAPQVFGASLARDTGLNLSDPGIHNGLSGKMVAREDHFEVVGVPLTPVSDDGAWNPYQVIEVTVRDAQGVVLAQTRSTAPVSDELSCAKCHHGDTFLDILQKHDKNNQTNLVDQQPVLCVTCHGDPALGLPEPGEYHYLSEHIHGFHATLDSPPACYDCHPGPDTNCSRSMAHTGADGNCVECHGTLASVGDSVDAEGRIPWVNEPDCVTCHSGVAEVDTHDVLYRNATGHGGLSCPACHGSPHATVPSRQPSDNYQALQYQGQAQTIGSCGVCHRTSKGAGDLSEFAEEHGGSNPERATACAICHTSVSGNTGQWPHAFQWKSR